MLNLFSQSSNLSKNTYPITTTYKRLPILQPSFMGHGNGKAESQSRNANEQLNDSNFWLRHHSFWRIKLKNDSFQLPFTGSSYDYLNRPATTLYN